MGKTKQIASRAFSVLAGAALTAVVAHSASALTTTDRPASIIVWPKILVDTSATVYTSTPTDTLLELTNQSTSSLKQAHCFLVNSNGHCSNNPAQVCEDATDCEGFACTPGWTEIDFNIFLTENQPLAWYASSGLRRGQFPIEGDDFMCNPPLDNQPCAFGCGAFGCNAGQSNLGSGIPPVPEDPFKGSLTCIQFDASANPSVPDQTSTRNAFTGHATILSSSTLDVQKYNAIGIAATGNTTATNGVNVLQLGLDAAGSAANREYDACPQTLIMDHLFDGATDPLLNSTVETELTLVPCGSNFLNQDAGDATAQFLVFNEFEQRFSTSRRVDCQLDTPISNIDTRNSARSIFSAGVSGTIAGQTRIRGVGTNATGRGLLGVARVTHTEGFSAAFNLYEVGTPSTPDIITLP